EPVIGLEVHAQIASPTKLFSPASANLSESDGPNSNVSVIDAAFPGVLPTLQRDCVNHAITAALALSSTINMRSSFDRKHYFYPDLPAGFQITQRENPIARGGKLLVDLLDGLAYEKEIRILQIQLEQDSGKTVDSFSGTLVDLNRAGVGVLEIVTEADIRSADEALAFMRKMQRLLWHNKISSPEMDEGAWRCDVNVSVREYGSDRLGSKTEMKHISKFSTVRGAIEFEIGRQIDLLESGERVSQETRGVDDKTHSTFRLRGKEDSPDYRRYMPEPDLPLLLLNEEMIENVRLSMVESLDKRRRRLMADYSLPSENVEILMA
ncbi:aspartyl/glutamyl-tRNA amidotransferase subunit B, partial [Zopfochytrium polystomum]